MTSFEAQPAGEEDAQDAIPPRQRFVGVSVAGQHFQGRHSRAMSIQFVGSKSLDDRRRRRLAVNGDGAPVEGPAPEEGPSRVESELVMSAAAAPWVPVYEWRIWTYGAMLGLLLTAVSFALAQPSAFRPELAPLTRHLLQGSHPVLAAVVQTMFWCLCGQLAMLISWYRAQCKLDFNGRYRVWPWAAAFCGLAAFCSATNAHLYFSEIVMQTGWLAWRSETVAWLLPTCVAALPLTVLIDRDVRRGRSTVYTLRTAWLLGLTTAGLELFAAELPAEFWYPAARSIVPLFFGATLFLGFWLHARVVAFVCPDPPECDEPGAASQLLGAGRWCAQLAGWLMGFLFRRRTRTTAEDATDAKPKRRSRKTADAEEDATPKRKRKAPVKRASKPRVSAKVVDEEDEDDSYSDETEEAFDGDEAESSSPTENEWEDEDSEVETPPPPARQTRTSSSNPPVPKVQPKPPATPSWQERPAAPSRASQPQAANQDDSDSEEDESEEGDSSYRIDEGLTAEQMRGLSKRQKRELRQKIKDQQRNLKR